MKFVKMPKKEVAPLEAEVKPVAVKPVVKKAPMVEYRPGRQMRRPSAG